MKVLHLLDSPRIAGTELHVLTLAKALREHGVETVIACPADGEIARRAGAAGLATLPFRGSILSYESVLLLVGFLRGGCVHIVHAHDGRTSLAAALAVTLGGRGKVVATQHFITPSRLKRRGLKALLSKIVHRWVEHRIAGFIAISNAVREGMLDRRETTPQKIRVVPNGINTPVPERTVAPEDVRRDLGASSDGILIACAARLEAEKDLRSLVHAMAVVCAHHSNAVCVIAGEGSQRAELEALISSFSLEKKIRLLGFRNDVPAIISAADVFVLPSLAEPFGLVLLEAMALGRPVVATAAGGPLEIVDDGQTGLLTPPSDPTALANAILRLASDPTLRLRMGPAGRERFRERFTAARVAAETAAVYRHVLSAAATEESPRARTSLIQAPTHVDG